MIPSLPGRDLTPEELALLVHELAARREEWNELVRTTASSGGTSACTATRTSTSGSSRGSRSRTRAGTTTTCRRARSPWSTARCTEERLVLGGPPHRRELPTGRGHPLRPLARAPPAAGRRLGAGDLHPRLLAAPVAPRRLRHRRGGPAAPRVGLVRRGAAPRRVAGEQAEAVRHDRLDLTPATPRRRSPAARTHRPPPAGARRAPSGGSRPGSRRRAPAQADEGAVARPGREGRVAGHEARAEDDLHLPSPSRARPGRR